jgi:hypothetical protein
MTNPRRFLLRMTLFLAVVVVVIAALEAGLERVFRHNIGLNSLICGMLVIGIALNYRRVWLLIGEANWVKEFRGGQPALSGSRLRLLSPLATMLGERRDRLNLSPLALRTLLDGIASRLDESQEISRYFTGLMIFLGLLGTFWGLSQTVSSISDVIRSLTLGGDDVQSAFAGLKEGLNQPLAGMGTAFSTSLIGLSGSLVLGFLDLQAAQAQNAFYNDLEEWLSAETRLSSGTLAVSGGEGGEQPMPAFIQALLEQTADSLDNLQRVMARGEEGRVSTNANMRALTDRLSSFADQMKAEQSLMIKLAENQIEMKPLLARIAEGTGGSAMDDSTRAHIRNIDQALSRMADETLRGRDEILREVRGEFRLLARTIAAIADDESTSSNRVDPSERL